MAVLLILVTAYLTAYYALVTPRYYKHFAATGGWEPAAMATVVLFSGDADALEIRPIYSHGGQFAQAIFAPAHFFDRMLRPKTWRW